EERAELNGILGVPELIVTGLSKEDSKEAGEIKTQMNLPENADLFQVFAAMPDEQFQGMKENLEEELKK
ncbi:hypothetical protein RFZ44_23440, partial [Acinetobacter sp. 163]|nr:hypothetical protein [Acinetobacter sp. 163]